MKNYMIIFTFAMGLVFVQGDVWAGPGESLGYKDPMAEHVSELEAVESDLVKVGNRICPVSGRSVDSMGEPFQVEHDGKLYNLCCKMCAKSFEKDPKKYSKIAEEEVENHEEGESEVHKGSYMEEE